MRGTAVIPVAGGLEGRVIPAGAGNRKTAAMRFTRGSGHPRGCGEQGSSATLSGRSAGSSPRVRGTGLTPGRDPSRKRVIPAGTGNRGHPHARDRELRCHPRGCGEQGLVVGVGVVPHGSSPRVRGTEPCKQAAEGVGRVIPAGAGNSATPVSRYSTMAGHPRGCGEQTAGTLLGIRHVGSSPRVRGTGSRHSSRESQ